MLSIQLMREAAARWRKHGDAETHPAERNACYRIAEGWLQTAELAERLDAHGKAGDSVDAQSYEEIAYGGKTVDLSEGWGPPARTGTVLQRIAAAGGLSS